MKHLWFILLILAISFPSYAGRNFDGATQHIETAAALVTATPLTICAWFKTTDLTNTLSVAQVSSVATNDNRMGLWIAAGVVQAAMRGTTPTTGNGIANAAISITSGVWQSGCAVFTSPTDRSAYVNGGNVGTNATNRTAVSLTVTSIGVRSGSTYSSHFAGDIGPVGFWNVALTANEVAAFHKGVPTNKIRPLSLLSCPRLMGLFSPEIDECGARSWTLTGAPTRTSHPLVIPWGR